jgi:hypothetical protein
MKATVIRASNVTEKDLLASLQGKLDEFLAAIPPPQVRFICQSEYTPERVSGLRAFSAIDPHITVTILYE